MQEIPEAPYRPETFVFPKRAVRQKEVVHRSCQATWFQTWKWLHYIESGDKVLCQCCTAVKKKKITLKPEATDAAICKDLQYYSS